MKPETSIDILRDIWCFQKSERYSDKQIREALVLAIESLKERPQLISKTKELEDAIDKCERAEKEFKRRTCKFRSPNNCDFCAFHSECVERWKEGEAE